MADDLSTETGLACPDCATEDASRPTPHTIRCAYCAQTFQFGRFQAQGADAMEAQAKILADYNQAVTARAFASYSAAVVFALISAAVVIFAPEARSEAATLIAGAFLILAVGVAGFTRFKAKAPTIEFEATGREPGDGRSPK